MKLVPVHQRFRIKEILPKLANFWIDIDPQTKTINIPATGELGVKDASILIEAINHAISVVIGCQTSLPRDMAAILAKHTNDPNIRV
jgi:hypothetical protein